MIGNIMNFVYTVTLQHEGSNALFHRVSVSLFINVFCQP